MIFRMIPSVSYPFKFSDFLRIIRDLLSDQRESFIELFQGITEQRFCFDISNGRAGLFVILKSLKPVKPEKKEVLVSAFTCQSVGLAVKLAGFIPVYYDIDEMTLGSNVEEIKKKITPQTFAVISSSLFGIPSHLGELSDLCRNKQIYFIEDNAHVLGLTAQGKTTGSFGDASFYSFGPSKSITSVSGGMISTNDSEIADRLSAFHLLKRKRRLLFSLKILVQFLMFYILTKPILFNFLSKIKGEFLHHPRYISPFRMCNIQFAIAKRALYRYEEANILRKKNSEVLQPLFNQNSTVLKTFNDNYSYIRFPVIAEGSRERDKLISTFRKAGIWAVKSIFFPVESSGERYPIANNIFIKLVLLPANFNFRGSDIHRIENAIKKYENSQNKK